MELLTVKNETTVGLPDPVAPLTVPIGPGPTSSALAPLNAAMGNEHKASEPSDEIGLDRGGQSFKNLVFLAIVGLIVWKYGKGVLNA